MCVIAIYTKKYPDLSELEAMELYNYDGGGIGYRKRDKVFWKKGLNAEEIYTLIINKKIKLPFIVHFRQSTVGGTKGELCHPFPITPKVETSLEGNTESVLFHNGHWGDWKEHSLRATFSGRSFPDGEMSDTRAIAWLVSNFGSNFLPLIDEKVVLLSSKNIKYFGDDWEEIGGVKYSNLHWKISYKSYYESDNMSQWNTYKGKKYYKKRNERKKNKKIKWIDNAESTSASGSAMITKQKEV